MDRVETIQRLRAHAPALRARGAISLFLFGSVARDQSRPGSDIDLFIDYDPNQPFSLIELIGMKHLLEDELEVEVDVTTRDSLHPQLKDEIERAAIRVF